MEELIHIVKGCLNNNREDQNRLYRLFAGKMYAVCLRYAAGEEDARDLLQDGFVKVFQNLQRYKGAGSLEGWMRRVFVNLALDRYRSSRTMLSIDEQNEAELDDNNSNALDLLSEKEIMALIRQLPDQYRLVFNLHVLEGYPHQEIASMLGIAESTSRSNLARAKEILKGKIVKNTAVFSVRYG